MWVAVMPSLVVVVIGWDIWDNLYTLPNWSCRSCEAPWSSTLFGLIFIVIGSALAVGAMTSCCGETPLGSFICLAIGAIGVIGANGVTGPCMIGWVGRSAKSATGGPPAVVVVVHTGIFDGLHAMPSIPFPFPGKTYLPHECC